MDTARHKEIMAHAEVQFGPQWAALRNRHNSELREAQFRARQTNNSAAMLPAEAACYIAHAKALVVARAKCIADAYSAFNEPVGQEGQLELASFFATTVAARKSSFQGEAELRGTRTRSSTNQLVPLLRGFEREARPALEEARAISRQAAGRNEEQAPECCYQNQVRSRHVRFQLARGFQNQKELAALGWRVCDHTHSRSTR